MATSPGSLTSSTSSIGNSASTDTRINMVTSPSPPPSSASSSEIMPSAASINTNAQMPASPPSSFSTTGKCSSSYCYSHEPFSTFRHKIHDLCIAIGLGPPTEVTQMQGGSYNRFIGLVLPNHPPAIIRIPRLPGQSPQGIYDQHAVTSFLGKTVILVLETIAYDATTANLIESEYTILPRSRDTIGRDLSPPREEREGMHPTPGYRPTAEMENIQFPATGQLVAAGCLPDVLVIKDSDVSHGAGVATASFRPGTGKPPQLGPTPTTLEDAFADRFRVWDAKRSRPTWKLEVPMFAQLSKITAEMRSLGFFEEYSSTPNVLHHWDFEPRNIVVERGNGQYKVTGVLDWDSILSVPLVLARKPPAWLWLPEMETTSSGDWWDGDVDELELGPAELRELFECVMEKRVGGKYAEDAFGKGRWVRRVWRFLLDGFQTNEDLKRFKRFIKEWNSYRGRGRLAA